MAEYYQGNRKLTEKFLGSLRIRMLTRKRVAKDDRIEVIAGKRGNLEVGMDV